MALPLGALLLGGGLAGRLCHPGTDQAPQGQGLRVAAPSEHDMQGQAGPGPGRWWAWRGWGAGQASGELTPGCGAGLRP